MTTAQDNAIVIGKEAAYNTAVIPARALPFLPGETLSIKREIKQSMGLTVGSSIVRSAARRVVLLTAGAGSVEFELQTRGMGLLLEACMGTATSTLTTTPGLYQQVFTLGGALPSLTVQKQLPSLKADGSGFDLNAFTFAGGTVEGFELTFPNADLVKLKVDCDFASVTDATAAVSPLTYPSGGSLYHFGGVCVKSGTVVAPTTTALATADAALARVKSMKVAVKHNLTSGMHACTGRSKPIPAVREISGTIVVEYVSGGPFVDAVMDDTTMSILVNVTAGSSGETLQVLIPAAKLGDELPKANAGELIELSLPFEGLMPASGEPLYLVSRTLDTAL